MINIKFRECAIGVFAALALVLAPGSALASSSNNNSNAGDKVTICHATGSSSNPYVMITPNANGVVNGHIGHQDGDDIIPPFDYNNHGTPTHFSGQNWDSSGQAIFNNGCKVTGGMGGGQKDCDNDYDNSPASDCTVPQPQQDCDGDYDNSPATDCSPTQPQKDCDNDYDNSLSTECAPVTGGMGGGPTGGTTTSTTSSTTINQGQVLGANTTSQVAVVPQGSVNGGEGAASKTTNPAALVGLLGSLVGVGSGLGLLNRRGL